MLITGRFLDDNKWKVQPETLSLAEKAIQTPNYHTHTGFIIAVIIISTLKLNRHSQTNKQKTCSKCWFRSIILSIRILTYTSTECSTTQWLCEDIHYSVMEFNAKSNIIHLNFFFFLVTKTNLSILLFII